MSNKAEYKFKIIQLAVQQYHKDNNSRFYGAEKLADMLKGKLELTGDAQMDLDTSIEIIKEFVRDSKTEF